MVIVSKSPLEYASLYNKTVVEKYAEKMLNPSINRGFTPLFVDTLWTTALALNATEGNCRIYNYILFHVHAAELNKDNKSLRQFSYDSTTNEASLIFNQ